MNLKKKHFAIEILILHILQETHLIILVVSVIVKTSFPVCSSFSSIE